MPPAIVEMVDPRPPAIPGRQTSSLAVSTTLSWSKEASSDRKEPRRPSPSSPWSIRVFDAEDLTYDEREPYKKLVQQSQISPETMTDEDENRGIRQH